MNYLGEILQAIQDILNIADKYKSQGYSVNLIFLGDVFDAGSARSEDAMQLMEIFYFFTEKFSNVWSVVGNHEITYASNNPFWFLVAEIRDDSLSLIRRFIQPRGITGRVVIPDKVVDGEVSFFFNHFGTEPKLATGGKVRIGLFHQNVGSSEICKMWGNFDNVEDAPYVQGYTNCFFGHIHMGRGEYWLNKEHTCTGEWLGTIGRTKVDEIVESHLEVNIPAVLVEDGRFVAIDKNFIQLPDFDKTVDKVKLEAYKKGREKFVERKKVATANYTGKTLLDTLNVAFASSEIGFLLGFLNRSWNEVFHEYQQTLNNLPTHEEESSDEEIT